MFSSSQLFLVEKIMFGDRLKEERKRLGMSQTDFASLGGVTKFTQINYEKGDSSPNLDYMHKLYGSGVDAYYILTGQRVEAALAERPLPLPQRLNDLLTSEQSRGTADAQLLHELLISATKLSGRALKTGG